MIKRWLIPLMIRWSVPLGILMLWQSLSGLDVVPYHILPSPLQVLKGFYETFSVGIPPNYTLPRHIVESLLRVFMGFFSALILGISLGILMGWVSLLRELLMVPVGVLRPIPPLAWIPIAILWFGIGIKSAIFIIFLGAFFPILLNTILGILSVDRIFVEASLTLGARNKDILFRILTPGAMPSILTGLRIGLGVGWMTLVAAEYAGVKTGYGLGYMIMVARDLQRPDQVISGMIVIGILGYFMDWFLRKTERKVLIWV